MRCQAAQAAEESCEDLADRALARAWAALSPKRFAAFPSLPALLAYLRTCVTTTAIDAARDEQPTNIWLSTPSKLLNPT